MRVEDLMMVRNFGAFTSAEKQLVECFEGRAVTKVLRQQLLEAGQSIPEFLGVFVLDRSIKEE